MYEYPRQYTTPLGLLLVTVCAFARLGPGHKRAIDRLGFARLGPDPNGQFTGEASVKTGDPDGQ